MLSIHPSQSASIHSLTAWSTLLSSSRPLPRYRNCFTLEATTRFLSKMGTEYSSEQTILVPIYIQTHAIVFESFLPLHHNFSCSWISANETMTTAYRTVLSKLFSRGSVMQSSSSGRRNGRGQEPYLKVISQLLCWANRTSGTHLL